MDAIYPVRCLASLRIPFARVRVRVSGLEHATIFEAGVEQAELDPDDTGVDATETALLAGAELTGEEKAGEEMAEVEAFEGAGAELAEEEVAGVETFEGAGADATLLDADVVA